MSSPLPAGYLNNPDNKWESIKLSDLALLVLHVLEGAKHKDVGFEDAANTLERLMGRLDKRVNIPRADIQSALWSCNLLDEKGAWRGFKGESFDQYLKRVAPKGFNKKYNVLKD